jgi:hypothetical protein
MGRVYTCALLVRLHTGSENGRAANTGTSLSELKLANSVIVANRRDLSVRCQHRAFDTSGLSVDR